MPDRAVGRRWAAGAMAAYALLVLVFLARVDFNPEWFIHFGDEESTILPKGRAVLGDDVLTPHDQGQDGQTFWLMARDPLLIDTEDAETYIDRPAYRSQRVLYPLLAAPARLLGERALVWALVAVNLAVVGVGTLFAARLADDVGAPPRAALAFAFNPAVVVAVLMDTGDALALAAVVAGSSYFLRRRTGPAVAWFTAAALAKEISIVVPVALAGWALVRHRKLTRDLVALGLVPALVAAAWAVYVRVRLDWPPSQIEEVGAPLAGFRKAWTYGWVPFGDWGHAAVAIGQGVALAGVLVLWWRRRTPLLTAAVPFALLYPFLSGQVVNLAVNSTRAAAPALTFAAMALYGRRE
jgi:hypothetical protein